MADNIIFSRRFHSISKRLFYPNAKDPDPSSWPEEWTKIFYKKYTRLLSVKLPIPDRNQIVNDVQESSIFELLQNRKTTRNYVGDDISTLELSCWLKYVCGETTPIKNGNRRTYPSGGARYSVEHYIVIFKKMGSLESGVYHYRTDTHELEILEKKVFSRDEIAQYINVSWAQTVSFAHVMTSVFWRSQNKYGERGYRLILLEAGHVSQNAYLLSEALGLGCCALSGVFDDNFEKLLGLDGESESVVHTVVVGR